MPIRIYQSSSLQAGDYALDEAGSHHVARVLRSTVGDHIILFNGDGCDYPAIITQITKKSVQVTIENALPRETESPVKISLAQGIARGEKMDFIIQKAVELGVSDIHPLMTERCNVRLDKEREQKRLQHWQAVVISACEQSGRNRLPTLHTPKLLHEWLQLEKADQKFILLPDSMQKLMPNQALGTVAILIGPEGGLSDNEIEKAIQHGFTTLNLGPRVLRTETAALAALAILQFVFGDAG